MPRYKRPRSKKLRYQKMRKKNRPTTQYSVKKAVGYVLASSIDCDATVVASSPHGSSEGSTPEIPSKDSSCSSWSPRSWSPDDDEDSTPSPISNRHNGKRKADSEVTPDSECSENETKPEVSNVLHKKSGEIFGDSFIKDRLVQLQNSVVVPVNKKCTLFKPKDLQSMSGLSNLVGESNEFSTALVPPYELSTELVHNGYKIEPNDELSNLVDGHNGQSTTMAISYGLSNNLVDSSNQLTNLGLGLSNNLELSKIKQECVYIKEEPLDVIQQESQLEIKQKIDSAINQPEAVFLNEFPLESIVKEEDVEYI